MPWAIEPKKSRDTSIGRMGPAYGRNILLRRRLAQSGVRANNWTLVEVGASIVVVGGVIALLVVPVGIFFIAVGLGVAFWGFYHKAPARGKEREA